MSVHEWISPSNQCNLFYFHGLQSHGGWAHEMGDFLASNGVNVFLTDRRGSGLSEGKRGHVQKREALISDYRVVIEALTKEKMKGPYWFLGQSFGASILASYLTEFLDTNLVGLIFVSPALGQVSSKNSREEISSWDNCSPEEYRDINLPTSYYTTDEKFIKYINEDYLAVRKITISTKKTMHELDNSYLSTKLTKKIPVFLMAPKNDRINNIDLSEKIIVNMFGEHLMKVVFDTCDHYLEYSSKRKEYFSALLKLFKEA